MCTEIEPVLSPLLYLSWLEASLTWRWTSSSRNQRASGAWWSCWTSASPPVRRRCGASSPPSSRRASATCRRAPKWGLSSKYWTASPQLTAWLQVEIVAIVLTFVLCEEGECNAPLRHQGSNGSVMGCRQGCSTQPPSFLSLLPICKLVRINPNVFGSVNPPPEHCWPGGFTQTGRGDISQQ